jgi:hypothetical protein
MSHFLCLSSSSVSSSSSFSKYEKFVPICSSDSTCRDRCVKRGYFPRSSGNKNSDDDDEDTITSVFKSGGGNNVRPTS